MHWSNLFYRTYWLTDPHIASPATFRLWVILLLVCIAAATVLLFVRARAQDTALKQLLQRWSSLLYTLGLVGLILFAFREQSAPVLSWRLWFLFLAVGCLPWFVRLCWYTCARWPKIKQENAARNLKAKYLPENK